MFNELPMAEIPRQKTKASIRLPARGETSKGNLRREKSHTKKRELVFTLLILTVFSVSLIFDSLMVLFFTFVFLYFGFGLFFAFQPQVYNHAQQG